MTSPSRFAERVLSLVVRDAEVRDAVIGDLREEHARAVSRMGVVRARRWHLRQSLGIAGRYGFSRLLRRKPPVRWISMATDEPEQRWSSGLNRDLLYAWRAVAQRPALSVVVVVTLAVALAANSTTYSLLDALVLRPYRFIGVDRLLVVTTMAPDSVFVDREDVSAPDFREWRQQATSISEWSMHEWWDLRRAVAAMDPDQPLASLMSLEHLVADRAAGFTFIARALSVVALIALVLSMLGIYSLMAYLTTQRTQEIGVRMALGAGRWQVVRLTTAQAVRITLAGVAIGGAMAFGIGTLMQSLLFGTVAANLWQLALLMAVLGLAALLAAYLPARRAARIDPMNALRQT